MPAPLAFSDQQLDAILRAAGPLAPGDRTGFLEEIAAKLDGQALGDGLVFRVIREVQARYLTPPASPRGGALQLRRLTGRGSWTRLAGWIENALRAGSGAGDVWSALAVVTLIDPQGRYPEPLPRPQWPRTPRH